MAAGFLFMAAALCFVATSCSLDQSVIRALIRGDLDAALRTQKVSIALLVVGLLSAVVGMWFGLGAA